MPKFTLSDLLAYGGKCFQCGAKPTLMVESCEQYQSSKRVLPPIVWLGPTLIELNWQYRTYHSLDALSLHIDVKSHRFSLARGTSEMLAAFLQRNDMTIHLSCSWHFNLFTDLLVFNHSTRRLEALILYNEHISIRESGATYHLYNEYFRDPPTASLEIQREGVYTDHFEFPVIPLNKIHTRQELLSKLTTYITFS